MTRSISIRIAPGGSIFFFDFFMLALNTDVKAGSPWVSRPALEFLPSSSPGNA
ncbi:MAG TPA: hypothetical protein VMP68_05230 [Candidatus Eisenbacteria bacterium]|nr:hypothetical protein [Candidatus Eisenbacteria bacterium]